MAPVGDPLFTPEMSDEDRDFYRWYGSWRPLTPPAIAQLMAGANIRWWIVGGWAVDAFTGIPREHEDIDVSFFRADLPALLDHLGPKYCVWSNASGTLRPLRKPDDLLEDCRQLWVRRDGRSPWLFDLAMNPHEGDTWISARHEQIRMPIDEATFMGADGIRYLQPEIVLWMKAHRATSKDERDVAEMLPRLESRQVDWLRATLEATHPGHQWLRLLPSADET
jgi:aminoglycoside-2''-adenylyltransferase